MRRLLSPGCLICGDSRASEFSVSRAVVRAIVTAMYSFAIFSIPLLIIVERIHFVRAADCQVYNNLHVCLGEISLRSVSFVDVNAVQTIDDIELHLENLGISQISDDAFADVKNGSSLYLRYNHLTKITRDFLLVMDQLSYLDMSNNRIVDIEDGAFSRLPNLETLILDSNSISNLRPATWKGLSNLHELYLTNNSVVLKKNMFKGLKYLETLALDANGITKIPSGTFHGLPKMDLLYLARNSLSTLNVDVFRGLHEVNELDLSRNCITVIPRGVFKYLKNLDSLWLNGNRLSTLDKGVFNGLENLSSLFLNSNDFRTLDLSIFAPMENVTIEPGFRVDGRVVRDFNTLEGYFTCFSSDYQEPYDCLKNQN